MPILKANLTDAITTTIMDVMKGAFDATVDTGIALEISRELQFTATVVYNEAGLTVTQLRTDDLTDTKTNSTSPVTTTEEVGPSVDRQESDRKNSGGQRQTTSDTTTNKSDSERRTAESGGDNTTEERHPERKD